MDTERGELERVEGSALDWRIHPFRERSGLGVAVLIGILAFSIAAGLWGGAWFWSAFSFLVLFLSLESFYFPTRFILEDEKLTVMRRFSKSVRDWGVFRRCMVDPLGVTLSPFAKSSWLETYRAIRLRFGPDNRERVLGFLEAHLGSDVEWIPDRRSDRG